MEKAPVNLDTYRELTGKIIGCAMQVHRVLGSGFQEVIYQRALTIELEQCGVPAQRELEIPIHYRQKEMGTRRVDFLVDETISRIEGLERAKRNAPRPNHQLPESLPPSNRLAYKLWGFILGI